MKPETRLAQMKKYLEEAMNDPIGNKLYIEDLNLSIKYFQANIQTNDDIQVMSGFSIDS